MMKSAPESVFRRVCVLVGATLIGVVVLFALVEAACCAAWSLARWLNHDPLRPEASPAYAGAPWVPEMMREQSRRLASPFRYVPFRVLGESEWHGKYFNNDAHAAGVWRRTANPSPEQCGHTTSVWIFGGSTVYGTGVPDWGTLPSYLSHSMNRRQGDCVAVTNYGDESYVSTQELMLLMEQLKRGGRPDIVIFYDGFNDAHSGMMAADPWSTHYGIDTVRARVEGSIRGRFDFIHKLCTMRVIDTARAARADKAVAWKDRDLQAKAAIVLDNYQENHKIAAALAQAYHFRFYGFWQPMLFYGHKPLAGFERHMVEFDAVHHVRFDVRPVVPAYREAERRAPRAGFVFLADVFDSVTEAVYIDEAHLAPRGNELVADAIAKNIADQPASDGK